MKLEDKIMERQRVLKWKYNWDIRKLYMDELKGAEVIDVHVKDGGIIAVVFMKGKKKMKLKKHAMIIKKSKKTYDTNSNN